jgi:hypothetical protein
MFGVCMRFSVFVLSCVYVAPCDGPVTRPRSPTVCDMFKRMKEKPRHPYKGIRGTDQKKDYYYLPICLCAVKLARK